MVVTTRIIGYLCRSLGPMCPIYVYVLGSVWFSIDRGRRLDPEDDTNKLGEG